MVLPLKHKREQGQGHQKPNANSHRHGRRSGELEHGRGHIVGRVRFKETRGKVIALAPEAKVLSIRLDPAQGSALRRELAIWRNTQQSFRQTKIKKKEEEEEEK